MAYARVMVRRRALTPKQRAIGLSLLFLGLFGLLGLVVGLGLVLGEPFLGRCVQGTPFACKNRGFNDARCLMTGKSGYCTHLCESDADCEKGTTCDYAEWQKHAGDHAGRVERVCQKKSD